MVGRISGVECYSNLASIMSCGISKSRAAWSWKSGMRAYLLSAERRFLRSYAFRWKTGLGFRIVVGQPCQMVISPTPGMNAS